MQAVLYKSQKALRRSKWLYLMLLLPVVYIVIFKYVPMYGVLIAFKDYTGVTSISKSEWVGLTNFIKFFNSPQFMRVIPNTLTLSLYGLIAGFPMPILLALSLNCCTSEKYKKTVQLVTYAPHFISTVVMVGIIIQFLNPRVGLIGRLLTFASGTQIDLLGNPGAFSSIYVISGIWQSTGWSSIIYLAALSSISPELHEAAVMDGASRFRRVIHIDIPGILPTVVILLIMNAGRLMEVGFEKALLMQNNLNLRTSEIIQTYVYKIGLTSAIPNFSYASAIGVFNSVANFVMIMIVNQIARKLGETSLW